MNEIMEINLKYTYLHNYVIICDRFNYNNELIVNRAVCIVISLLAAIC